jgi:hypothetical protein
MESPAAFYCAFAAMAVVFTIVVGCCFAFYA